MAFRLLAEGNNWVAFARLGDVHIKIDSSGFPLEDVTLASITDTRPYLTSPAGLPR